MKTIKFDKTECGVDFLLRTGSGNELKEAYTDTRVYNTDYFEILFFKKAVSIRLSPLSTIVIFPTLGYLNKLDQQESVWVQQE